MAHHLEHGMRSISLTYSPSIVASVSENSSGLNPSTQIEQDLKNAVDRIEKKFRPKMQDFRKSPTSRIYHDEIERLER